MLLAIYKFCEDLPMHADSATAEVPALKLPPELVTELTKRASKPRHEFSVEGWKPSLFGRLVEKLVSKGERRS